MMSKFILGVLLLSISIVPAWAGNIDVKEGTVKFDDGKHNALTLEIFGVPEKDILKAWTKKMKGYDAKVNKSRHGVRADGVKNGSIHEYPGIYLAKSDEKDNTVTFSVAVNLGGAYMNSSDHKDQFKILKRELIAFAKDVIREQVRKEIKEAEKNLKKKEKEMEKLKKNKEKLKKHIVDWKEDIKQAESDIVVNESDQKKQVEAIKKAKEELEVVKKKESQI